MRIYSMTATFGKLEHEKLTLTPGLNVITARNEWGKSTWCAFLTAMLYGMDTRAKSTKTALADKERYAPWSGSPMSGKMEIRWQGRDITIERSTTGRIPLGAFRAYETESGLEVPELTAENCGKLLLGVERSVFLRSGFIRLKDLPVTDDEALRRRLNNLVTTGDESGSGEKLAVGLKELKNKIRYHSTGLLPEVQRTKERHEQCLRELDSLERSAGEVRQKLDLAQDTQLLLENHRTALAYAQAEADTRRVAQAESSMKQARQQLETAEKGCENIPSRETAAEVLAEIDRLERTRYDLQEQLQNLLPPEEGEELPGIFAGMEGREAIAMAEDDRDRQWLLCTKLNHSLIFGLILLLAGGLLALWEILYGALCAGVSLILLAAGLAVHISRRRKLKKLSRRYGSEDPNDWLRLAERYSEGLRHRRERQKVYEDHRSLLQGQLKTLNANIREATEGMELQRCREQWQQVIAARQDREDAENRFLQAQQRHRELKAMAKSAPAPEFPDRLSHSPGETERLISECIGQRQKLEHLLGSYQGRMEALGSRRELEEKIAAAEGRIRELEQSYAALVMAQETLAEATARLQRRFAPRISGRARVLMEKMTDGRYDRLTLREDFGLLAGAQREDTLHEALWRSDGTVDQLYLALRLAVAGELMPHAPLVLDDALVRFDDIRLKAALDILKAEGERRQVILFSCQSREQNMV